jgi:thiol-disulfide isomerase/thioredoxin
MFLKNKLKNIALLAFFIAIWAQLQAGQMVVFGKIANAPNGEIAFQNLSETFAADAVTKVAIGSDGSFRASINLDEPSFFLLWHNRRSQTIFLSPKGGLEINFDAAAFPNSITFGGAEAAPNDCLREREAIENNRSTYDNTYFQMAPATFQKEAVTGYRDLLSGPLERFKARYPNQFARFVELENANIYYKWATLLVRYPPNHANITQTPVANVWPQMDLKTFDELPVDKPELLPSKPFRDFLFQYAIVATERMLLGTPGPPLTRAAFFSESYNNLPKLFKNKDIIDYARARIIYEGCNGGGLSGMEKAFDDFKNNATQPNYRNFAAALYARWGHLVKGKPAPDFESVDTTGKRIRLSDLKGKLVYIDVWATWCGPCRREAPSLDALQEKFKDKDVVFMSVSIDTDEQTWRNWQAQKQPKGLQVFTPGGWGAPMNKSYNITGIPRFMLIGKDGTIISSNEERPSAGAEQSIEQALAE